MSAEYSKISLLVDLINTTKNEKKKDFYKAILEVEILSMMDALEFICEMHEQNLAEYLKKRDEANTQQAINELNKIIDMIEMINQEHHEGYRELQTLLNQVQ